MIKKENSIFIIVSVSLIFILFLALASGKVFRKQITELENKNDSIYSTVEINWEELYPYDITIETIDAIEKNQIVSSTDKLTNMVQKFSDIGNIYSKWIYKYEDIAKTGYIISSKLSDPSDGKQYIKLKNTLLERGFYINIRSGYRTFEESEQIYEYYKSKNGLSYAEKYVAKPGVSEHNAGIAFDFIISKDKNAINTDYNSDEYFYLESIAYLYGFIIRYPQGKENITGYESEPWHFRYVGVNLAKYLKKNNLTLEEYYKTGE